MTLQDILAALLNPSGSQQAQPNQLAMAGAPAQVGDHNNPAALMQGLAAPQGAPQAPQQPLAPQQAPQGQPMPQNVSQAVPTAAPAPAMAPSASAMAQSGGGIGGFLSNLLNPQEAGKNQTIDWLKKQGMDEGTATMFASSKPALQQYLLQRSQGKKPIEVAGRLVDPTDYHVIADFSTPPKPDKPTTDIQNYEYYVAQEKAAGRQPLSSLEWDRAKNQAGVSINVGPNGMTLNDLPAVMTDARGVPDAASQQDFLSKLDPSTAALVKGVAEYRMPIEKVTTLKGNQRQQLAQIVSQYDPSFDMTQYGARSAMRKSITSGSYAQSLNSANLVIQHLDALSKAADGLNNWSFTPLNAIVNEGKDLTGNPAISRFNTAADAAAAELAKVFKGVGVSGQEEIAGWRHNLSINSSPAQIKQSIATAVGDLLKSRIDTIRTQYQSAMGKPSDFTFLTPHSRQVLQDLGVDPDEIDASAPSAPSPNAPIGNMPQPGYTPGDPAAVSPGGQRVIQNMTNPAPIVDWKDYFKAKAP